MELTARQAQIFDFIRRRVETRGAPPSLREIMDHFGFSSPATVSSHLDLLEKKGVIRREPGRARNILLPGTPGRRAGFMDIPVYGAIPAGLPDGREEQADRCVAVDMESLKLPRGARVFALEVRGDSMTGAGILDRDIVILELAEPRHRDIVAALIDGETTLKRFLVRQGQPFLRAENPAYPDLIPARELVIQGVLRALLRTIPR
ncbi:MAG: transcriptional repressor LexA [Terrimicrobiaceae bacterium]|nr:transcriptional repressor LexA [Terrimicrobiaceae bacterium]